MGVAEGSPPLPVVIVGTGDGSVRALDGRDGNTRWQFAAGSTHPSFQFALATDRGSVYAAAGDGLVFALRLEDGSLLWQRQLPYAGPPVGHRFDRDVRVAGGRWSGGHEDMGRQDTRRTDARSITVLDGATGAPRWVFTPRSPAWIRLLHTLGPLTGYFPDPGGAMLLAVDATGVYVCELLQAAGGQSTDLRHGGA